MNWPTVWLAVLAVCACKGQDRYAQMAKKANAARADAGEEVRPAPAQATLLAHHQNGPRQLLVDADFVYWLCDGTRGEGAPGIMKTPKSGGAVTALVNGPGIFAFALDSTDVFFVAPRAGKVLKVPKSGGEPVALADTSGMMRGVAVDADFVYWPENEAIFRVPKAGGKVETVVKEIISPDYLTVDDAHAYWYSSLSGNVLRAPKNGKGGAAKVYSNDKNTLHTIFIEGGDLFFTFGSAGKTEVHRMPSRGGGAVRLGEGLEPGSDYVADAKSVYWASEDALYKLPRSGGQATELVSKTDRARNLAVDATSVYWTDRGGRVQKLPK